MYILGSNQAYNSIIGKIESSHTMRNARLFAGTSHPVLAHKIANQLNTPLSPVTIQRYPNQEITVSFGVSVRSQTVYIIQSGSDIVNDHVMELMIMIRAARSSSASSVIVVMPYYSYSKQCKKKKSRGAIAAKLVADMLMVSGADHIITLDLHVYQISGFFSIPLDNLFSKPIVARWIIENIPDYKNAVVVSKNIGGAKRVTGLADALKIKFALIYMESKHVKSSLKKGQSIVALHDLNHNGEAVSFDISRPSSQNKNFNKNQLPSNTQATTSVICGDDHEDEEGEGDEEDHDKNPELHETHNGVGFVIDATTIEEVEAEIGELDLRPMDEIMNESDDDLEPSVVTESHDSRNSPYSAHPKTFDNSLSLQELHLDSHNIRHGHAHVHTNRSELIPSSSAPPASIQLDSKVGLDLHVGSSSSSSSANAQAPSANPILNVNATDKQHSNAKADKKNKITLIGDVSGKTVFLMDDLIDSPKSFVNVAEHLINNCNARDVYVFGVHGLFTESSVHEFETCPHIKKVVTTNSCPIPHHLKHKFSKLFQVDVSNLLAEAIRRNHNGESISILFEKV